MAAAAQILNSPNGPTAILCSNDLTAIGVMKRNYEEGVVIPRDLSLIGFDDVRLAPYMLPPLRTVQMSQTGLAMLAFKALLARSGARGTSIDGNRIYIAGQFIVRKSTAISAT
jgi:DNA-binding LacI/PurR family transcriptional regulator